MLGLLSPDEGEIEVCGVPVHGRGKREALRNMGALVEGPAFYPYLSGRENLQVFAAYSGDGAERKIPELIELAGLRGRERDRVGTYSLGMKQRLGIAQALLNDPRLLILDEPTNGLDPYGVRGIRELITRLSREFGTTIFLSSHILGEVQQICDTVAVIHRGKITAGGEVEELLNGNGQQYEIEGPKPEAVREFIRRRPGCSLRTADRGRYAEILREKGRDTDTQAAVRLRIDGTSPERFLTEMVRSGMPVREFKRVQLSLEDFFFGATEEQDAAMEAGTRDERGATERMKEVPR
jgi:ABC-2 type transport system ATP-binding protein